jgi:hypothetical protein
MTLRDVVSACCGVILALLAPAQAFGAECAAGSGSPSEVWWAAVVWLISSALLSWYLASFADYDATYGLPRSRYRHDDMDVDIVDRDPIWS